MNFRLAAAGAGRPCWPVTSLAWPWMELRIDVQLPRLDIERDLRRRHERLQEREDLIDVQPLLKAPLPGLVFRYRETDGEFHIYVEDTVRQRLAGYTIFGRVGELDREAARWVRAPHSRYSPDYQRRGIASAVYRWALNAGLCLVSGPRQSEAAHALWRSLSRDYACAYVALTGQRLHCLGESVDEARQTQLDTRLALFGPHWNAERFARLISPAPEGQGALRQTMAAFAQRLRRWA